MINNIITYVKEYGNRTFDAMPFCEADSLVLCQLSYLNYGPFVNGFEDPLGSPVEMIRFDARMEELFEGYWYKEENRELFDAVSMSSRFGSMRISFYENVNDEETDTQFSAVTYQFAKGMRYVAFRGTDASLIGWKEDMKLAYSRPTGSQKLAVSYLEKAAESTTGTLYTGGHSKGGNLAVYAAMSASEEVRDRIETIFNHDGPGFRPEVLDNDGYRSIRDRIRKYIPRSSAVGIILDTDDDYEVVDCWRIGNLQHNAYTWKSEKGMFLRAEGMKNAKKVADKALNEWILSLSDEEIGTFIDTVYDVLTASDAKNVFDIRNDLRESISGAKAYLADLDEDTKKALQKIVKSFIDIYGDHAEEEFRSLQRSFRDEIQALYRGAAELLSRRNRE